MIDITSPVLIFGSLIALLIGSIVHLIGGGKLLRLFFSMIFAWIGFWGGNYLANHFGIFVLRYGQIAYAASIAVSIITALFGFWISGENKNE